MKGIWKMLTGQGEKEYRKARKAFDDAIPDEPGFDPATHPAVSGPLSKSYSAFDYRRAHDFSGPKSKREHQQFADLQAAKAEYDRQTKGVKHPVPFWQWLEEQ
jgi:hypothetical protein